MQSIQVIFQSQNAPNGGWYDYCREQSPHGMDKDKAENWAREWCAKLKRRENCEFKFRVEIWR